MGVYFSAFLLGFLSLLIELVLIRALSYTLNSAVAWMCVSSALFGIGVSGVLFEWRKPSPAVLWRALGISLFTLPNIHNLLSLNGGSLWTVVNYAVLIAALTFPFALIGWMVLELFAKTEAHAGRIYFFDLAGAAMGSAAAYFLIGPLSPAKVLILAGWACFVFSFRGRPRLFWGIALLVWAAVLFRAAPPTWSEFNHKASKRLSYLISQSEIERSLWTTGAKIDVIRTIEGNRHVIYDGGEMVSTIYPFDGDYGRLRKELPERIYTDFWNPSVLASHFLKENTGARVLAIGAAGGQEIKASVLFGARKVEVVELVGELLDLGKTTFAEFNGGIFLRPEVQLTSGDGRAYLAKQPKGSYDIIQLNSTHGSSSRGSSMGALQISPLFTVEAFQEYFSHLSDDGILHLTFFYYPRVINTMEAAWDKNRRPDLRKHVLVIQSGKFDYLTTVLVKMKPWTVEEVNKVEALFSMAKPNQHFEIAENPTGKGRLPDEFFNGQWPRIAANIPYRIFPATDDQPYFKFLRTSPFVPERIDHPAITADVFHYLYEWQHEGLAGDIYTLVALGLGCLVIFGIAIIVAAVKFSLSKHRWSEAAYFFVGGFSFIALETYLVHRASMWLGAPGLSLAVALGVVLLAAGIGGGINRLRATHACLLAAAVATTALLIPTGWPVLLCLMATGLCMGFPFVAGVHSMKLEGKARANAFLISGIGSGIGGYCATVLSLLWGFWAVLAVASAGYLLAAIAALRK